MTPQDAELIVAIAALAAQADGKQDDAERQRIAEMAAGLGLSDNSALLAGDMAAKVGTHAALARITEQLSSPEARQTAYDTAVSVCYADGWVNPNEVAFLRSLATVGLLQYVGPTIQFLCGWLIFNEAFGGDRAVGFGLIWLGCAIYLAETLVRARRNAMPAPVSGAP